MASSRAALLPDIAAFVLDTSAFVPDMAAFVLDVAIPPGGTIAGVRDTFVLIGGAQRFPGGGAGSLAGRWARAHPGDRLLVGDERRHRWHRVSVCHPAARCLEA